VNALTDEARAGWRFVLIGEAPRQSEVLGVIADFLVKIRRFADGSHQLLLRTRSIRASGWDAIRSAIYQPVASASWP
jgi:hypothetical protein